MRAATLLVILGTLPFSFAAADDGEDPMPIARPTPTIALVDMAEVFKNCDEFKTRTDELKAEVAKITKQILTLNKMGADLAEAMKKTDSQEEKNRFERDIVKIQGELGVLKNLTQRTLARDEATIYKEVYTTVQKAVGDIARERGFTLVIRYSSAEIKDTDEPQIVIEKLNNLVVFAEPEHDITFAVIARLNGTDGSRDEKATADTP